jgi:uncharacterized integral membrane protein
LVRKLVAAVILVPLAILIVAFAVANRQPITVSFDPFAAGEPAASVILPLFVVIMVTLIVGVVIGGAASWLRQGKWRGAARRFERDLQKLRDKVRALEGAADKPTPAPGRTQERLRLRPPLR